MPNDVTGSYHAIPVRPARVWQRVPRVVPRHVQVTAQILGLTRGAPPPAGVAWRRALTRLLCKWLVMALIVLSIVSPQ